MIGRYRSAVSSWKTSGNIQVSFKSDGILVESLSRSSYEDVVLKFGKGVVEDILVPNVVNSFINSREEGDKVNVKGGGGGEKVIDVMEQ